MPTTSKKSIFTKDVMTKRVLSIDSFVTLREIQKIFRNVSFHHILVVDNKKLEGIISDRDVLKMISPFRNTGSEREQDKDIENKKAHQIMSRKIISIKPDAPIHMAVDLILKHKVSCLPVLDESSSVLGILSWKDLLKSYRDSQ